MKTAVILLAAGKSSRFLQTSNVPKALYPVLDRTWLEYSIDQYQEFESVVVSGHFHNDFIAALPAHSHKFLKNNDYEKGQYSSILIGLEKLKGFDQIILSPIDTGFIEQSTIETLVNQDHEFDIVIPLFKGKGGHPILLRKPFVESLLDESLDLENSRLDYKIKSWDHTKVKRVEVNDEGVVHNFNTKELMDDYLFAYFSLQNRSDYLGKQAGMLSLIEIGLGSFLHGLKIPFSGMFLSLNQGFFLTRTSQNIPLIKGKRTDPALLSNITAVLKSLSPAGKKLTPMLAISMQGMLYTTGLFILGNNFLGRLFGMVLLCLWSFIQPLGLYMLLFGEKFPFMINYFLKKLQKVLPVTHENLLYILFGVVLFKVTLGLIVVFLSHILSKEKFTRYEEKMLRLGSANKMRKHKTGEAWKLALKDLTHPLFLFSLGLTFVFFFYSKSSKSEMIWYLLRPIALGYIFFYFSRKINFDSLSEKISKGPFPAFGKGLKKAVEFLRKNA